MFIQLCYSVVNWEMSRDRTNRINTTVNQNKMPPTRKIRSRIRQRGYTTMM